MLRKQLTAVFCMLVVMFLFGGTRADASVVFVFNGGHWSHSHRHHPHWHRYWGGPSIGFYWAAAPVYVVAGYSRPSYYTGTTFWTSNPSFGININIGGGGGHGRGGHGGGGHGGGGHPYVSRPIGGGHPMNMGGGHGGNHMGGGSVHSSQMSGNGHAGGNRMGDGSVHAAQAPTHGGGGAAHGGGGGAAHGGGGGGGGGGATHGGGGGATHAGWRCNSRRRRRISRRGAQRQEIVRDLYENKILYHSVSLKHGMQITISAGIRLRTNTSRLYVGIAAASLNGAS